MATVVCCCEQTQPDGWQTSASVKGESAAVGVESNGRVIIRRNVQKEPRGESRTQAPEWRQRLDVWPAPDLPDSSSLATHSLQLAKRTACCILLFSPNLHPSEKKKNSRRVSFKWLKVDYIPLECHPFCHRSTVLERLHISSFETNPMGWTGGPPTDEIQWKSSRTRRAIQMRRHSFDQWLCHHQLPFSAVWNTWWASAAGVKAQTLPKLPTPRTFSFPGNPLLRWGAI